MPKSSLRARDYLLRVRKSIRIALAGPLMGLFGVLAVCFSGAPTATAVTSSYLNFQARLMSSTGAIVQDGNYNVEFKIYDASSSTGSGQGSCSGDAHCLWYETRTSGNQVRVVDGYLTVNLGSVNPFPSTMPWDQQLWLTMNIGGTGSPSWDGEMNPRIQLTAIPYAFKANAAAQIQNSSGSTLLTTSGNQISLPNATGSSSALTFGGDTTANLYRSASGTIKTDGSFDVAGALGIGVTNPQGALTIANSAWINAVDASGTGNVNILQVNSNNQIQLGAALAIDGGIVLPTDAGQVTFSDLPIDSSAATGTPESYTMRVGSTNAFTVYGESDGAGGVQNVRIAIGSSITPGYTLDVGGDANVSGVYRVGGVQICSSTGCTAASGSSYYIQNGTSQQPSSNFNISGTGVVGGTLTVGGNINLAGTYNGVIVNKYGEDANGAGIAIGAGGSTILGSGESAATAAANIAYSNENLALTSDNTITFYTNLQSGWSSRVQAVTIASAGQVGIGSTTTNGLLNVGTNTTTASGGLYFGTDVNLYRSGNNALKTDDSLQVVGNLTTTSSIGFTNTGNANQGIDLNMVVTSATTAGDIVVIDSSNAGQVTDSTSANSTKIFGVATTTNSAGVAQPIVVSGVYQVNVDTAAVNVGDYIVTSSTTGLGTDSTSPTGGTIGQALSSKSSGSNGTVWVYINPSSGVGSGGGGSGSSSSYSGFAVDSGNSLTTGLMSYWNLDEASGTTVKDSVNTNYGVANGTTITGGKKNYARSFNGTSDYVDLGNGNTLNQTSTLSISAWIKNNDPTCSGVGSYILGGDNNGYGFYLLNGSCKVSFGKIGISGASGNIAITDTTSWHHVVMTYSGSQLRFYVDGVADSANPVAYSTGFSTGSHYYLGGRSGSNYFKGSIDEVGLWNKVLSAQEVSDLYNGGNGDPYISSSGSGSSGSQASNYQLAYTTFTGTHSIGTSATTIVTSASATYDGSPVMVEFYAPQYNGVPNSQSAHTEFNLYEDGSLVDRLGYVGHTNNSGSTTTDYDTVYLTTELTPSIGSHTFTISADQDGGSGAQVSGTNTIPGYIRVTLANPSLQGGGGIQNGTALQTGANFNIQSITASSVTATIHGTTGQTADVLDVQDASNANLLSVSAAGNVSVAGNLSVGGTIGFSNTGNENQGLTINENITGSVTAGDVVVIDAANAGYVKDSSSSNSTQVFGIATKTQTGGSEPVVVSGIYQVNVTGTVNVGDYLVTSSTTGQAQSSSSPSGGIVGQAMSTASGGKAWALIKPASGAGGGGSSSSNNYGLMESDWTSAGTLPAARAEASVITVGNNLYMLGGSSVFPTTYTKTIYTATTSNPTSWTDTGKTLPNNLGQSQTAIIGNYIYMFGGFGGTSGNNATNVIYRASVSDPTTWVDTGATLPGNLASSQLAIIGNYIYLYGGNNGAASSGAGATNVIYRASVSDPLTWSNMSSVANGSHVMPLNMFGSQLAVIGNYVYVFGGYNGSAYFSGVYRASVSDPLTWTYTNYNAVAATGQQLAIIGNYVYLIGGQPGGTITQAVYRAPINDPVAGWTSVGNFLPTATTYGSIQVVGNALYLLGGYNGSSVQNTIQSAPIYNGGPDLSSNPSWKVDSNYSLGGSGSGTSSQTTTTSTELAYTENSTGQINVTSTNPASPNTVVTAPSLTFSGNTPVMVEFYAPIVRSPGAGVVTNIILYEDGSPVGSLGQAYNPNSSEDLIVSAARRIMPSAGAHTFSAGAVVGSGTGQIFCGTSVSTDHDPCYIRITLANPQLQGGAGIQNGTTVQTGNFNLQSSSQTSVTGILKGATSQSADVFEVQDASSTNLFNVGPTGNVSIAGNLSVGGTIGFSNAGNASQALTINENITGSVTAGDVVVIDTSNAGYVTDSTTANSTKVVGIATKTQTGGSEPIVISGIYQVNVGATSVNVGDYLVTSSTTGQATTSASPSGGVIGQTMSTASSNKAWALIKPAGGAGGSSGSSNNYGLMESDFTDTGATVPYIAHNQTVTIGNTIYFFGGADLSTFTATNKIYSAPVSNPTNVTYTGFNLPNYVRNSVIAIVGSNIYLYGGIDNTGTAINAIYTASVSNPTSWSSAGTLPGGLALNQSSLAIIGSNIYFFGGLNGTSTYTNEIYRASISSPATVVDTGHTVPVALRQSSVAVIGNYVYLFGGINSSGSTVNAIYRAPVSSPETGWTTTNGSFPGSTANASTNLAIIGNYIYLIDGYYNSGYANFIWRAPVSNPVNGWADTGSVLPNGLTMGGLQIVGNAIYLYGGIRVGGYSGSIYSAPIYSGSPDVSANPSWITDSNYSTGGGSGTSSQTANTNYELAYAERNSNSISVTATGSGSYTTIVTAPSITMDGNTPINVEVYSPYYYAPATNGGTLFIAILDNGSVVKIPGIFNTDGSSPSTFQSSAGVLSYRYTPSAGSHTFTFAAFESGGQAYVGSGDGTTGSYAPAYIRVTLANPQIQGGSGIANGTTTQTANFNVQSSSASSVTAVIQGATSQSADILEVKDSSNTNLLAVDPSGNLTVKGNIGFANQGNANQGITLNMKVTSAVTAGDVVVIDTANAGQVTDSTSANSTKVFGIATQTKSAGQYQPIVVSGLYQINVGSNSVNIGDYLVTDGSAGEAMASSSPTGGVVGQATSTASSSKVWALIKPASGTGGSGGGGMTTLYDSTLTSDTAGFDVSSIPGTYSQLKIAVYGRTAMNSQFDQIALRFNGDSSADYDFQKVEGNNTAVNGAANTGMSSASIGWLPGSSASNNTFAAGSSEATITNYAGTSFHKSFTAINSSNVAYTAASLDGSTWSDTWTSTSAINRIQVISMNGSNFKAGSRLVIYGIGGSNSGGSGSGGSGIVGVQTYTSGSGTFNLPAGVTSLQVELVGGGGGGGLGNQYGSGGGGGAGGYVRKFISSPSSSYSYAVGAAGAPWGGGAHTSGGTTAFGALSATGGTDAGGGTAPAGGTGGTGTGGDVNVTGGTGNDGAYNYTGQSGGNGGASYFGGGGAGGNYTTAGGAGVAYGSGGGGAGGISSSSLSGGYGAGGVIIVTEYGTSLQGGGGIQNGTTLQIGANFNIQSASPSSVTATIHGTSGQSADILDVQNSSNINLLSVDPNGNTFVAGNLNVGGTIGFSNIGNQNQGISLNMVVTSSVTAGDVVVVDTTTAGQVTDSTTANSTKVFGVATTTNSAGVSQPIIVSGIYQVNVDTAAVNIGDYLVTSSTTGMATSSSSPSGGVIGQALSAKAAGSNGTVWARINPGNGAGGSGSGSGYGLMESDFIDTGATLPVAPGLVEGAPATIGNYVYMFGGATGAGAGVTTIMRAPVSNPTSWTAVGNLPSGANLYSSQLAIIGSKIYLFGGAIAGASTANIYSANVSDPVGSWTLAGSLSTSLTSSSLAIIGSNIYLFGGYHTGTGYINTIYTASVSNPLSWSTAGSIAPASSGIGDSNLAVIGNYVYLFAGANGSSTLNTIYRAPISSPTSWVNSGGTIPNAGTGSGLDNSSLAIVGNYVYLLGGYNGGYVSVIFRAPVTDPVWGWATTAYMNGVLVDSRVSIVGNALYVWGGYTGTAYSNKIYSAPIINGSPDVSSNPSWITDSNVGTGGSGTSSQTANNNTELAYSEFTAPVTVSATSASTANTVVTATSISSDGNTPVVVEFFAPRVDAGADGHTIVSLYEDGSSIGDIFGQVYSGANMQGYDPVHVTRRLTPTAGAHTFSIRAWRINANGTVEAGPGGTGGTTFVPGYIRVVLANPQIQGGSGINNGTTTQTANFNIQSASGNNPTAIIQGASSQSADILDVRNSSGSNLLSVDANGNLGITGAIGFNNSGNASQIMTVNETVTTSVNANDVVVIDTNNAGQVTTTTLANSTKVFGVATKTMSAGQSQPIAISGIYQVNVDTAAVNVGDYLVTSGTAGKATDSAYPSGGIIGQAMSAKTAGSNGTVWVRLNPGNGAGGSGSGAGYGLMESDWTNAGTLPANMYGGQVATIGNTIYLFGGNVGGSTSQHVYTAPVSNPTSWTDQGAKLPGALEESQVAVVGSYVYLFGGYNGSAATNVIYYAPVSDPINSWQTAAGTLPGNLVNSQLAIIGSNIYLFGGASAVNTAGNVIYTASISSPTSWSSAGTLGFNIFFSQLAVIGNYVYMFGGNNGGGPMRNIYRAAISSPTSWVSTGYTLNTNMQNATILIVGDHIYLMAGTTVQEAPINNPLLWAATDSLPSSSYLSPAFIAGNAAYVLGGSGVSVIQSAPIYDGGPDLSSNPSWKIDSNGGSGGGSGTSSQTSGSNYQLAYNQFTSPVTISATSESTANTVVTASSFTADGATPYMIEFYTPEIDFNNAAYPSLTFVLYEDGSSIGKMGQTIISNNVGALTFTGIMESREITPSAGAHTFSIRAYEAVSNATVQGGNGGSGNYVPGYIRVTLANPSLQGGSGINNGTTTQTGNINIQSSSASNPTMVLQGATSQSADILDVKNSSGSILFNVGPTGNVSVAGNLAVSGTVVLGASTSDPGCTNGGLYYNTTSYQIRGCANGAWNSLNGIDIVTTIPTTNLHDGETVYLKVSAPADYLKLTYDAAQGHWYSEADATINELPSATTLNSSAWSPYGAMPLSNCMSLYNAGLRPQIYVSGYMNSSGTGTTTYIRASLYTHGGSSASPYGSLWATGPSVSVFANNVYQIANWTDATYSGAPANAECELSVEYNTASVNATYENLGAMVRWRSQ
ncbi:MAG TPA: capsid cement protein [Candidatus Saccharimonadales bacterium]|nr:capsid cement protein [Candidatus Saccharimonadales bacterium]